MNGGRLEAVPSFPDLSIARDFLGLLGFRVQGFFSGLGFRLCLGFGIAFGFRVLGLGFRVEGCGRL